MVRYTLKIGNGTYIHMNEKEVFALGNFVLYIFCMYLYWLFYIVCCLFIVDFVIAFKRKLTSQERGTYWETFKRVHKENKSFKGFFKILSLGIIFLLIFAGYIVLPYFCEDEKQLKRFSFSTAPFHNFVGFYYF